MQHLLVEGQIVVPLLKGDAEDVAPLHRGGAVIRVDLHDVVIALALGFEDGQRLLRVARGDDAVGHLQRQQPGGGRVALVREGGPVAIGAQPVGPPGPGVGAGDGAQLPFDKVHLALGLAQGQAQRRAGGADVLEGRGGGQAGGRLELADQLPGVERVHKIDIAGTAVEHRNGQLALLHQDAGGLLIGVAAVFKFQFGHGLSPLLMFVADDGLALAALEIHRADEEGDLVVFM